jgi:pimeloyl-ACP methyl ester carboxylesterase
VDNDLAGQVMTRLSRGTLVSIPDARHAIFQSQPEATMQAIHKFLASL